MFILADCVITALNLSWTHVIDIDTPKTFIHITIGSQRLELLVVLWHPRAHDVIGPQIIYIPYLLTVLLKSKSHIVSKPIWARQNLSWQV